MATKTLSKPKKNAVVKEVVNKIDSLPVKSSKTVKGYFKVDPVEQALVALLDQLITGDMTTAKFVEIKKSLGE